jgi:hypothetical protein
LFAQKSVPGQVPSHVLVLPHGLGAQPVEPHASQQLVALPKHAVAPAGALQCAASRLILHFVTPAFVTQQVTAPAGFPQIECAAHRLTAPAQLLLTSVRFACRAAQLT